MSGDDVGDATGPTTVRPAPSTVAREAPVGPERRARAPSSRGAVAALAVLSLLCVTVVVLIVLVLLSRAQERDDFDEARREALAALDAADGDVFASIDELNATASTDTGPLVLVVADARQQIGGAPLPRTGDADAARHLRRAAELDSAFLSSLAGLAARPLLEVQQRETDAVEEAWEDAVRARTAADQDGALGSERARRSSLRALTGRLVSAADEERSTRASEAQLESSRIALRTDLQQYHDDVVRVLDELERRRDELEAQDWGAETIETSEQQDAFETAFSTAAQARSDLADDLAAMEPPAAFSGVHADLVEDLQELASIVDNAWYAAGDVYCYDPAFEPCQDIGTSSYYIDFLNNGALTYEGSYVPDRIAWIQLYEREFRQLYGSSSR